MLLPVMFLGTVVPVGIPAGIPLAPGGATPLPPPRSVLRAGETVYDLYEAI